MNNKDILNEWSILFHEEGCDYDKMTNFIKKILEKREKEYEDALDILFDKHQLDLEERDEHWKKIINKISKKEINIKKLIK